MGIIAPGPPIELNDAAVARVSCLRFRRQRVSVGHPTWCLRIPFEPHDPHQGLVTGPAARDLVLTRVI